MVASSFAGGEDDGEGGGGSFRDTVASVLADHVVEWQEITNELHEFENELQEKFQMFKGIPWWSRSRRRRPGPRRWKQKKRAKSLKARSRP